jgi:hypothetical protein
MPRILTNRDAGDETPSVRDLGVVVWRFDCLIRAGYPEDLAVRLAENADVDLHDAVELLSRGCPVREALRILT